jgi:hypothetical protein
VRDVSANPSASHFLTEVTTAVIYGAYSVYIDHMLTQVSDAGDTGAFLSPVPEYIYIYIYERREKKSGKEKRERAKKIREKREERASERERERER